METRSASPGEWSEVIALLDAGLLETDPALVREAVASGDVLVAVEGDRVLGALLLSTAGGGHGSLGPAWADAARVEAVAVRRGRRGQGLGTALVEAAVDRHDRLVAGCDDRVRPFWVGLGFEVSPDEGPGRHVGTFDGRQDG